MTGIITPSLCGALKKHMLVSFSNAVAVYATRRLFPIFYVPGITFAPLLQHAAWEG